MDENAKIVTLIEAAPSIPHRRRVAAYARVSSAKDAMKHSLSAQVSHYSGLIQQHWEWEFAGVYADDAVTGTKEARSEFQRLLADCRAGRIDLIITKSVTRFARNTVTTLETVRELKLLGVDVYFEKENIHSISGDGELMLSILASYAQEESLSASENQKWRVKKLFEAGKPSTGTLLGYRLMDNQLQIVPHEAVIVRQIFADYLDGMGKLAIVKKLRTQGVKLSVSGVSFILRNEKYAGELILQKSFVDNHITKRRVKNTGQLPQYHVAGSHEAIIDRDTFDAVQAEIARRAAKHQPAPHRQGRYPLTGIIVCGKCGAPYRRKHAAAGSKYEKIVWICPTFNELGKSECDSQQIPEDILERLAAEVGGIDAVEQIVIPSAGTVRFRMKDGAELELAWENPSRRHSWTPEMKQAARERQLKIMAQRGKQDDG